MADTDLLQPSILRQIGDKLYEKRKAAALEVEQIVKRLAQQNDKNRIRLIIDKLIGEYAFSTQSNNRKGALLCLAAAAVALGEPTEEHLRHIVPPVLASFTDADSRVRYYACEALYNIAKVARGPFIIFFNEVFDAMFRLCADADPSVQSAIQFLDSLVKDIVTAAPATFNAAVFIPKLREYLRVAHPSKRQFLLHWITVLDSVPDLDMLRHLPSLVEGLMGLLSDPNREIRVAAHKAMMEFLSEISLTRAVDFAGIAPTLVAQASSTDEFTRLTSLKWLKVFVELASPALAAQYASLLAAVLLNISHPSKEISEVARQVNTAMLALAPGTNPRHAGQHTLAVAPVLDCAALLSTVSAELVRAAAHAAAPQALVASEGQAAGGAAAPAGPVSQGPHHNPVGCEVSRLEALRWVHLLLARARGQVLDHLPVLLPALLDAMVVQSESVALGALGVFAAIARCPGYFRPVLRALLGRFRGEAGVLMLQSGGAQVIRRLCTALGSEAVFVELAGALEGEQDLTFASTMVQALSLILLTSPEVRDLREVLRGAAVDTSGHTSGTPREHTQHSAAASAPTSAPTSAAPLQQAGPGQGGQGGAQPGMGGSLGGEGAGGVGERVGAAGEGAGVGGGPGGRPSVRVGPSSRGPALFAALYPCWSHAPGALLGLCLLAQAYDHVWDVLQCYRWLPMGSELLVQVDRLVQLLDTPAFTFLRLQLLQPRQHAPLLRAMYAMLMLLPQSNAFRSLSTRLAAVPTHALLQLEDISPSPHLLLPTAAAAASAPWLTSSDWALDSKGPPAPEQDSGHSGRPAANSRAPRREFASSRWSDIDLAVLLKLYCARQQRHYLVELGDAAAVQAGSATVAASHLAAAVAAETAAAAQVQLRQPQAQMQSQVDAFPGLPPPSLELQQAFAALEVHEREVQERPCSAPPATIKGAGLESAVPNEVGTGTILA